LCRSDSFFAKEWQMQPIGDACYSLPVQQGGCYEPVSRLSAQSAISIDVLLRDGHFAADSEGAAGGILSRGGLFALVFVEVYTALHPAHGSLVEPPRDDVARA